MSNGLFKYCEELEMDRARWNEIAATIRELAQRHLQLEFSYEKQAPDERESFIREALSRLPALSRYEDEWPLHGYTTRYLPYKPYNPTKRGRYEVEGDESEETDPSNPPLSTRSRNVNISSSSTQLITSMAGTNVSSSRPVELASARSQCPRHSRLSASKPRQPSCRGRVFRPEDIIDLTTPTRPRIRFQESSSPQPSQSQVQTPSQGASGSQKPSRTLPCTLRQCLKEMDVDSDRIAPLFEKIGIQCKQDLKDFARWPASVKVNFLTSVLFQEEILAFEHGKLVKGLDRLGKM
ncbi:hypothetical protein JAAARDRAFT_45695 [Jaapia argillacea MUCL 33604]|uniref:Uncharacterized protein n=1 Tax=Jaapia argillacea MUCL 33604 TaxID=933084 RepID=A0A067QEI8_9AGAM|nr:hypothetical protein JAAARDRAFT_45695 [Jaapia argillacea MUCL 33604]